MIDRGKDVTSPTSDTTSDIYKSGLVGRTGREKIADLLRNFRARKIEDFYVSAETIC